LIVDGGGLLASAFRRWSDPSTPGLIFARGVADSSCEDEVEYARETTMLRTAIERARELGQTLVYFAGAPIYGSFGVPVREEDALRPTSRYGRHQAEAEDRVRLSGAKYLALRLPNVVGPGGHRHQLIPALAHQIRDGAVTVQIGAGRDLIDVADTVNIVGRLLAADVHDVTLNVATGICTPVTDIVAEIIRIVGRSANMVRMEGGDSQQFDVSRLRAILGPLVFDAAYPFETLRARVPEILGDVNP
jgi:nucleoside-diphosphate-sugar epimerase